MTAEESWVTGMRAISLAKLLLTERDDLEIIDQPAGHGYDMLVRVHAAQSAMAPEFAVEVKGTRGRITTEKLRDWLIDVPVPGSVKELPWCLFIFQVESRRGMYCWLQEPVVAEGSASIRSIWEPFPLPRNDGAGNLVPPPLSPLNEGALDAIVARVVTWTQIFERSLLGHARAS